VVKLVELVYIYTGCFKMYFKV